MDRHNNGGECSAFREDDEKKRIKEEMKVLESIKKREEEEKKAIIKQAKQREERQKQFEENFRIDEWHPENERG